MGNKHDKEPLPRRQMAFNTRKKDSNRSSIFASTGSLMERQKYKDRSSIYTPGLKESQMHRDQSEINTSGRRDREYRLKSEIDVKLSTSSLRKRQQDMNLSKRSPSKQVDMSGGTTHMKVHRENHNNIYSSEISQQSSKSKSYWKTLSDTQSENKNEGGQRWKCGSDRELDRETSKSDLSISAQTERQQSRNRTEVLSPNWKETPLLKNERETGSVYNNDPGQSSDSNSDRIIDFDSDSETESEFGLSGLFDEPTQLEHLTETLQFDKDKGEIIEFRSLRDDTFLMDIPQTSLKKAVLRIRQTLKIPDNTEIDLFSSDATLLKEDADLKALRGSWVYLVRHTDNRTVSPQYRTGKRDMFGGSDDEPRVCMSCNHAITPDNLYEYCWNKVKAGAITISCPAVTDHYHSVRQCGQIWNLGDIFQKACLSEDEKCLFQSVMFNNYCQHLKNIFKCPDCGVYLENVREDKAYFTCISTQCPIKGRYCVRCYSRLSEYSCQNVTCIESTKKLQRQLESCAKKSIIGVSGCPTLRACPGCRLLIEHDGDACKHMDCPSEGCKLRFCFICLSIREDGINWPTSCGGAFQTCKVATVQTVRVH